MFNLRRKITENMYRILTKPGKLKHPFHTTPPPPPEKFSGSAHSYHTVALTQLHKTRLCAVPQSEHRAVMLTNIVAETQMHKTPHMYQAATQIVVALSHNTRSH